MRVRYIEDVEYFEETGMREYPSLVDGEEYVVTKTTEYEDVAIEYEIKIEDIDGKWRKLGKFPADIFEPVLYACPCCGRNTLEYRENYNICKTCYWEDEPHMEERPDEESTANDNISLNQYRKNWIEEKKKGVYNRNTFERADTYSRFNRTDLEGDNICGCFYCLEIFSPKEIYEWCCESARGDGVTALCPHCGIDSVIGESSGYPITKETLKAMNRYF